MELTKEQHEWAGNLEKLIEEDGVAMSDVVAYGENGEEIDLLMFDVYLIAPCGKKGQLGFRLTKDGHTHIWQRADYGYSENNEVSDDAWLGLKKKEVIIKFETYCWYRGNCILKDKQKQELNKEIERC